MPPDEPNLRTAASQVSDARLSLRTLLILGAILALFVAVLGPVVRRLPDDDQLRLISMWAIWLAIAIAWVAHIARCRRDAERLAGTTLVSLPMFDESSSSASPERRFFNVGGTILPTLMYFWILSHSVLAIQGWKDVTEFVTTFGIFGLISTWWIGRLASFAIYTVGHQIASRYIWPACIAAFLFGNLAGEVATSMFLQRLDLCKNGVVLRGFRFWTWQQTQILEWTPGSERLVFGNGWRRIVAFVSPDQQDLVELALRNRLVNCPE